MDLNESDVLHRNDLSFFIKESPDTNFLLIENAQSPHDINVQLTFLKSRLFPEKKIFLGLTKLNYNTALWVYDAPGPRPHNEQENYRIYPYIKALVSSVREEDFVEKHKYEVMYINDWWKFQAQFTEENRSLKIKRNQLYEERLKTFSNTGGKFDDKLTARIDVINHSGNNMDVENDIEWLEVSGTNVKLQAPLWFLKDGQGYVLQSDKGQIRFRFRCIGSGMLEFTLRGIFKQDSNKKHIPCWIDYTAFSVNREPVLEGRKSVWHDSAFKFSRAVSDGDIIECEAYWTEHNYGQE